MHSLIGAGHKHIVAAVLTAVLMAISWSCPPTSLSQSGGGPSATVAAIQGEGEVTLEGREESQKLRSGDTVQAWNSISTGENSRLFLNWDNGVGTSMGDFSSLFLSRGQTATGESDIFQVVEGIVRVATGRSGGAAPYSLVTPVALIEPAAFDQPADFIVEVYDSSTTVLTVVAGDLRVSNLSTGDSKEQIVSQCQTVYIEQGKARLEALASSLEDVNRLIGQTTLPGTILATKEPCAIAAEVQPAPLPPRVTQPEPLTTYAYPSTPEYYVEDWDEYDFYPYEEITVLPPRPGIGCVIVVPGIGEYVIPLSYFDGWVYDPGVVVVWARRFFLERLVYNDWDYLRGLRARQRHLHHAMYLAQLGRNPALLRQARNELDFLNLRTNWLGGRLRRLEGRVAGLQHQEQQLAPRLPRGLNLNNALAQSFTSPANLAAMNKLQQRLRTDREVQNRLVNVAGNELAGLRSQLAREKDPQKRLALRNDLARFRSDVAEGKLPISPKQSDLRNLVTQLSKEKNPNSQEKIQKQLLGRLDRTEAARMPEALDPTRLTALKQDLTKFPNPAKRSDLENQVTQLQQSVQAGQQVEANRRRAEELAAQAARERNPEKQKELIGKMQELSTPLAIVGGAAVGAGAMKLMQQRQQHLEQQISGEKDREKRATLQQSLEDLKKRQTDLQKQEQLKKPQELQRMPGVVPPTQLELKKLQQLDLRKQQEEKRTLQLQQKQQEREQQLQLRKQQQEDRAKALQQRRLEQEDRAKALQQRRLEQEDRKKQLQIQQEQLRLKGQQEQEGLKLQKQEQLRLKGQQEQERLKLQQQDREKQIQQQRLKQQDQEKVLQQRRLDQEQQKKQSEELKRQQQLRLQQDRSGQEQERIRQQQLKLQEDKSRQQQFKLQQDQSRQQQLKLQQEQSRQQQLKLQEDKARQQQQLKLQQDQSRQQQLKLQQQQQQQQQQLQQQQMKQQQEQARQQQLKLQQDQARQQQLRQQQQQQQLQQQQRLKQLQEEEAKKLKK
ncbi:MAG: hypothetical protein HY913_05430 [Desulfomonile tiedjei]|nr:hypothetical protein [Desulfomonile tiedjei]